MTAAPRDSEQAILAPVLELTVMVAQAGYRAVPRIEPPALLRPFLGFTRKAPKQALRAARRVLDEDEGFRARLAPVVTDDVVGEAGVLYVTRPPGWVERLAELAASDQTDIDSAEAARSERSAERRLEATSAALERAEEALAKSRLDLDVARAQLAEERRERGVAGDRLREAAEQVEVLRSENGALRVRLRGVDHAEAARAAEFETLRIRNAELEVELQRRGPLDAVVGSAVEVVQQVHAALLLLRGEVVASSAKVPVTKADTSNPVGRRRSAHRRRKIVLPGGVLDDSGAATQHLLRAAGVRVLIDGYNVAKFRWPSLPPNELRDRLIAAIAPTAARTGAALHVVFDGDGDVGSSSMLRGNRVRVSFTAKGREADDEILDLLRHESLSVPVVVVSNDRRVVDGAIEGGASTLSVEAFMAGWSSSAG